jgi:predicted kinase
VLGPVPGAVIFRSDEIRKELFGVDPLERLGPEAYTADVTERVYAEALARAQRVVRAGHAAVVDAVFGRPEQRVSIERAAREAGVPFAGIWLDAPAAVLEARIGARRGDVSDADVSVVRQQLARDPGPVTWARVDASGQPTDVAREARNRLASTLGDAVR